MQKTVADVILEQLRLWGVKRIYGVVGDSIFGLMDAIAKQEDITFISVKHESVAAMMASAEAKLTGQLAVCIAHMGPGLANLLNGLGDAFMDKAPVLAITGQAPMNKIGTTYKQYIDQQKMIQAISLHSQLVVHPDAVIDALTEAMQKSVSNKTVSHLSIPNDLLYMVTTSRPDQPPRIFNSAPSPEGLQYALEFMRSAKQPMILAGSGLRLNSEALTRLAETWGCGIVMSYGAIGVVPDANPFMLNGLGEGGNPHLAELFKESDVVLALATDWWPDRNVPSNAHVVQVAEQHETFGISLPMNAGLIGDISDIVLQMIEGLINYAKNPLWVERIQHCKQTWLTQNEIEGNNANSPLHPSAIIRTVELNVADDAVITLDEGDSTLWFLRNFRARHQQVLLSSRWRTMGFGLPAALSAKLCYPQKEVICITGDGGLGMVLADLLTAARYGLAITVIVFQNGNLQMEQDKMFMKGLRPKGTLLTNPDFAKAAEACGWHSQQIKSTDQLKEALKQSKISDKPVLLNVFTANIPHPDNQTS